MHSPQPSCVTILVPLVPCVVPQACTHVCACMHTWTRACSLSLHVWALSLVQGCCTSTTSRPPSVGPAPTAGACLLEGPELFQPVFEVASLTIGDEMSGEVVITDGEHSMVGTDNHRIFALASGSACYSIVTTSRPGHDLSSSMPSKFYLRSEVWWGPPIRPWSNILHKLVTKLVDM